MIKKCECGKEPTELYGGHKGEFRFECEYCRKSGGIDESRDCAIDTWNKVADIPSRIIYGNENLDQDLKFLLQAILDGKAGKAHVEEFLYARFNLKIDEVIW